MNLHLHDRVTIIGGSSRGIGLATARAFLSEGSRVVLTGRDRDSLTAAESELKASFGADSVIARAGDTGDAATAAAVVSDALGKWNQIDCLVANVGMGAGRPGWDISEDEWTTAFDANFASSRRLVEAALPIMTAAGRGSIVTIASIVAVESLSAPIPYSAAKAALVSYSKNLARAAAASGVRVNAVAPGNVLFPGGSWDRKRLERPDEVQTYIAREVPMKRFGTPEEIASIVVFLASERASFITGSCIVADGGQTRGYLS
jgi:3-oxoacyl-[acyl-carrier protein] reductase